MVSSLSRSAPDFECPGWLTRKVYEHGGQLESEGELKTATPPSWDAMRDDNLKCRVDSSKSKNI